MCVWQAYWCHYLGCTYTWSPPSMESWANILTVARSFTLSSSPGISRSFRWSSSDYEYPCMTIHLDSPCSRHLSASFSSDQIKRMYLVEEDHSHLTLYLLIFTTCMTVHADPPCNRQPGAPFCSDQITGMYLVAEEQSHSTTHLYSFCRNHLQDVQYMHDSSSRFSM